MTDLQLAQVVAFSRRKGYEQACGVVFVAFLVAGPIFAFFALGAAELVGALSCAVLVALVIGGVVTTKDPEASGTAE